jgi:hypothetical protein
MSWSIAGPADVPGILQLISPREWECVNLSSRISHGGRAALPAARYARIALYKTENIVRRCIFFSRHGMIIPYLPGPNGPGDAGFTGLHKILSTDRDSVQSMMGIAGYVRKLSSVLDIHPSVTVDYHLMVLDPGDYADITVEIPEITVRPAGPRDSGSIMPLQEAYEREEVVIRPEYYDREQSLSELKLSLTKNIIFIAEYRGRAVAKAGTNARGFSYDQIGGVFTRPDMRGKKIARVLMKELLASIFKNNKGACLFVKKTNTSALKLYRALGFRIAEDYQISYFHM